MRRGYGVSGRAAFALYPLTASAQVERRRWRRPPRPGHSRKEERMDEEIPQARTAVVEAEGPTTLEVLQQTVQVAELAGLSAIDRLTKYRALQAQQQKG